MRTRLKARLRAQGLSQMSFSLNGTWLFQRALLDIHEQKTSQFSSDEQDEMSFHHIQHNICEKK